MQHKYGQVTPDYTHLYAYSVHHKGLTNGQQFVKIILIAILTFLFAMDPTFN